MSERDNFRPTVVETLAKRASYICSNPNCRSLTLYPSQEDPTKAIFLGVAAHITAASPNGPRYDPSLTPEQRSAIENGIFLCELCATLIDKNKGADFSVELLRTWKQEHEVWVTSHLNKSASVLALLAEIQRKEIEDGRKALLHAVIHELYVDLNVLLDSKFNPDDAQLGKFVIYPRLMVTAIDKAISSGIFKEASDGTLFRLMYSWKEVAAEFNHRLNLTEQQMLSNPSSEVITKWQITLCRTGRTLPNVRNTLRELLEHLLDEYAEESGIERDTLLFSK